MQDEFDQDQPTRPQPNSLDPGDPVCAPVQIERRRRKTVDLEIDRRLMIIESVVVKSARFTRMTAIGLGVMVAFAALEYAGILGDDKKPIWASAVIDGVRFVVETL